MSIYTVGCVLTVLLQCTDIRLMWDQRVKGTCWTVETRQALGFLNIVLNILTDIAFSVGIPVGLTLLQAVTYSANEPI
jgi:hypothetical protein